METKKATGADSIVRQEVVERQIAEARRLYAMAESGSLRIDPETAAGIASAFEQVVEEIGGIKFGVYCGLGRQPELGTSPYATRVAAYEHDAASAFYDAAVELESVSQRCAEAFRESARRYVAADQDAADELNRVEGRE